MAVRVLAAVDALCKHVVIAGQVGIALARRVVAALEPALLVEPLRELVHLAHAVCDLGQHAVERLALELGARHRLAHDDEAHVAGIVVAHEVRLLDGHEVGQQQVCVLCRVGQERVPDHDELALGVVAQDLVGRVDVAVLVGEAVACIVEDHLDRHVELVLAAHTIMSGGKLGAVVNCFRPKERGDGGLDGVVATRQREAAEIVAVQVRAGVSAVDAHIARQDGQHADCTSRLLSVALALRALALPDGAGLGLGDLMGKIDDGVGRHATNGLGPRGRLLDPVLAQAHDVALVGLVLSLGTGGHVVLVVADAVRVEEVVVDEVFLDEDVRHGIHERGVRAGANGDPLVGAARHSVAVARVNDDDLCAPLLERLHEMVGGAGTAGLGFDGVLAEHDDEL